MTRRLRAGFRLRIAMQILFLAASIALAAWTLFCATLVVVPIVIGCVVLLQLVLLLRSVESHVDTLEDFFESIRYEDFTRRFVEDDVDVELKEAFNRVIGRFRDARAARDLQAAYLETVVRHVPIPFISVKADGTVGLVNNPARRLTGISSLTRLDQLGSVDPALPDRLRALEPGSRQLLQSRLRGVPAELRVSVAEIRLPGGVERLYSIENLSGELTARESSAWRNLIRVLTHEIMNTLTPVSSLAATTVSLIDGNAAREDIREAVETIARRSAGLTGFVQRYRELLKVPDPEIADIAVAELFESIVTLMSAELAGIAVRRSTVPESLQVRADRVLVEQVLVNLVRNSVDALAAVAEPRIELGARLDLGRVVITVVDNGDGIDEANIEQVFVPFFTTKRDGSGIGLSLCRQIMTAHGGDIAVESANGATRVSLIF